MAGKLYTLGTGRVGSGTDFSSLASAWAALQSGDVLWIFPGTYTFTTLSSAVTNVTVIGMGNQASVILQTTDTTHDGTIIDINHAGYAFYNLTIQGANSNTHCNLLDASTTPDLVILRNVKLTYQGTHECRLAGQFWVDEQCVLFSAYNTMTLGSFAAEKIVYYGTGNTTANHLYYLAAGGGAWTAANATAVASGERKELAIAMGATFASGMMTRGYHNIEAAQLTGAWVDGGDIWMDTTAGHFAADASQPSASGNVVRYLGYGTNQANTFYFDPAGDWGVVD